MRYCTNCGAKLGDQYKFCPYCGHEVENDFAAPTPENVAAETPFDETQQAAPSQSIDDIYSNRSGEIVEEPSRDDIDNYFNGIGDENKAQPQQEQRYSHNAKVVSPVFAILALVFGILGGWLGIVFGAIGISKYKKGPYRNMSIAGLVLAIAWIAITIAIRVTDVLEI